MGSKLNLVYLRVDDYNIDAFVADLPPKEGSSPSIFFRGPINVLAINRDQPEAFLTTSAVPYFDGQKDEILWSCPATTIDNHSKSVNVLRIGRYFALQSVERTTLGTTTWVPPSIILEGGSVNVCSVNFNNDSGSGSCSIVRRGEDGSWIDLGFKSTNSDSKIGPWAKMFQGPGSALKRYILCIRAPKGRTGNILFDQISASRFKDLARDKSLMWQNYDISLGFHWDNTGNARGTMVPFITNDESSKERKSRLHLFSYDGERYINFAYVPLRSDGSIDSLDKTVNAQGAQKFDAGEDVGDLKVTDLGNGKALISWQTMIDGGAWHKPMGKITTVGKDGLFPNVAQWQDIKLEFDPSIMDKPDFNQNWSMAAVVVPADFSA